MNKFALSLKSRVQLNAVTYLQDGLYLLLDRDAKKAFNNLKNMATSPITGADAIQNLMWSDFANLVQELED